jgi:hypothetical protein
MELDVTRFDQAARARFDAFAATTIAHPALEAADREVQALIEEPAGSAVVLVFGPTGVGKSTLIDGVVRRYIRERYEELQANPQLLPPITIRAAAPSNGQFSWRDFMIRGLEALGEPVPRLTQPVPLPPEPWPNRRRLHSVDDVRKAFEVAIQARRPAAIFIDEAQHLTNVGAGRRLDQLDFIKSLSDATDSVFFLVGTYDLMALRNLNGQLGRRAWDVHLPRYRADDVAFRSVANTFADALKVSRDVLLNDLETLYVGSAGCVGILKQWLLRALARAFHDGRELRHDDLGETMLTTSALKEIALEIASGESAMVETESMRAEVRELLMGEPTLDRPASRHSPTHRRVGKRLPGRDPVGAT